MSKAAAAYELLKAREGQSEGAGDWFVVSQERINDFADATLDHQFIINYGMNKMRFIHPVPAGSSVRASSVISEVVLKGSAIDTTRTVTVEIDGIDKPALIAEWIGRTVFVD